ncbi:hypothetical protein NDU88_008859 [Pleurodeles waltl]|uniref:Uncharacterized protein n=1 Tax=Pleurodeles waltl TaxID=8319 RepID=A0AAV7P055_PLEWA|nr:hypothetical protein NDU88_008859 [Pleurodeles waltl]
MYYGSGLSSRAGDISGMVVELVPPLGLPGIDGVKLQRHFGRDVPVLSRPPVDLGAGTVHVEPGVRNSSAGPLNKQEVHREDLQAPASLPSLYPPD